MYPSLYEGFGMPVLEALSLDCPVLTSEKTVMQEIAGNAALYFNPESVESIAAAIKLVYEPSFDRSATLKNGPAVVSRYSWENSGRALLGIFTSLAPAPGR
jgi:glycosyltransferase involved in cell wall biosynthesis